MPKTEQNVTVYKPNQKHDFGVLETWQVMMTNIVRSRELVWQLFRRDFLAVYKKSFLGITWIFITPVLVVVSWIFLQKTGILQPGDVDIPYPAYVLIGTLMWGLFLGFYQSASRTLTGGRDLVLQVNFPHEALLFKETAQHLAAFLVAFLLNIVVLVCFKVVPSAWIIILPLVALPLFLLGSAVGLIVSMISVVAIDISRGIDVLIGLLMFATPVIYADDVTNPLLQTVIKWNPLTYLVCSCRDLVIYGTLYKENMTAYLLCVGISLVLFLISWRLFFVSENKLVERMI